MYLREAFSGDKNDLAANCRNRNRSRFFRVTAIFLRSDSAFARVVPPTFVRDLREILAPPISRIKWPTRNGGFIPPPGKKHARATMQTFFLVRTVKRSSGNAIKRWNGAINSREDKMRFRRDKGITNERKIFLLRTNCGDRSCVRVTKFIILYTRFLNRLIAWIITQKMAVAKAILMIGQVFRHR